MESSRFSFGALLVLMVVISQVDSGNAIGCIDLSIGIENTNIFPNARFTATTSYDNRYVASNGRLQVSTYGWGPRTNLDSNDHLQIDLGHPYVICAVGTQGGGSSSEWVTSFTITASLDGSQYTTYQENGADKLFTGNTNQNSIVKNPINELTARYIRFYPRQYRSHKVMRVGIFGYREECAKQTIGVENKHIIPDGSFTATSFYDSDYVASNGRLNNVKGWAAKTNTNPNDYLQIDLGLPYIICAVATQGNSISGEWVTSYKIHTSLDNNKWTPYQESGVDKVFQGNVDDTIIMANQIIKKAARYIRFIPTAYNAHKTMRVGIFGYVEACDERAIGMESGAIQDGSITASSAQYPAMNARLNYTSGSSWCASTSDSSPYLQIDLGIPHLICAVATQGNNITDQWVKKYQIKKSNDGTTWTTYTENSITRTFYGNYDRTTPERRLLYHGVITRYLRILPKTHQGGTPCLRTEIYGYAFPSGCSSHSVGIPSSSLVPDHRFTATSEEAHNCCNPYKGRLGADPGWLPKRDTAPDYLQVDLGDVFYMCAVATQGHGGSYDEWVTRYKVLYSTNNKAWTTYRDESGNEHEFNGNSDRTTVVTNSIRNPFRAKFVRVFPTAYHNRKMIRIDFKGLPSGCSSSFGIENSQISDSQMTSSSSSDSSHTASRGRLYGSSSWCSATTSNTEYIQVDLRETKTVTGIATQGDKTVDKWTITYKVSYSFGEGVWFEYKETSSVKTFNGNSNKNDVIVNWLTRPMAARYVRISPQVSNIGHCLRFELYGCEFFYSPIASLNTVGFVLPSLKNSSQNLKCSVLGEPTPDIQWLSNGTKINGATQPTLQVQFISAEDIVSKYSCTRQDFNTRAVVCTKFYTCRTKYIYIVPGGTIDEATAEVTVHLNVSQAPTVTAIPFQRSIRLSWILPDRSDELGKITSCTIELNNQSSINTILVDPLASPFNLTNLRPYTNYTVRMRAISAVGQGLWSILLHLTTIIAEPDGVPTITSLTALTSQSIRIDWQFIQNDKVNGPMSGFRITYRKEGGPTNIIDVGNILTYNLTALEKNTNYKFNVSVRNELYIGQPGAEKERRTLEDAPECAPVLKSVQSTSSNSALLIWSSLQNGKCTNGVLRGYKVVYRESVNESASLQVYPVNIPSAITAVVTGLVKSVEYTFQVLAFTVKDGPLSNTLIGTAEPVGNLSIVGEKMTPLLRAAIGEKVSIGCYATGAQPIRYKWLKDGAPTNSSSVKVVHNFLAVEIKSMMDFGVYLCNVTNNRGEAAWYEVRVEQLAFCEQRGSDGNLTISRNKMASLVRAAIGDRVIIGCYATGGQPIRYHWTLNGGPVSSVAVKVIQNILVIEPKTSKDYGTYVCNVTNENGTDSYSVKLLQLETCKDLNTTQGNLTMLRNKMTSLVKAALDEKVILSCYATGTPPIRYIWLKDGAPINTSSIKVIGNTVILQAKNAGDYGTFLCKAANGNDNASYEIQLVPSETCPKPNNTAPQELTILREKMSTLVKAAIGQNVSIGCYATGTPPIRYKWTRNGAPISSSAVKVIDNILFVQPKTAMDYGTYLCSVDNENDTVSYAIELAPWESCQKRKNPTGNEGKLKILINLMMPSVNVAIGNSVSLGCYATGVPPIKYIWTKDGIPMTAPSMMQNILLVKPNTSVDYGTYTCNVSNGNATDSYSIHLKPIEKCKPCSNTDNQTQQGKLQISSEKMTPLVRARYGDKVSIGCYATGTPPIKYTWTKNNSPIISSKTIKVLENVVVVHPKTPEDYGTYVCSVSNGKETATYVIRLETATGRGDGKPNSSQSIQEFKTTYLPIIIVFVIIIIIFIIIIVYLVRRQRKWKTSFKLVNHMSMDTIIQSRGEAGLSPYPALPPIPSTSGAASHVVPPESHYDSINDGAGYVNAAALSKDEPKEDNFEDVYALKNSRA